MHIFSKKKLYVPALSILAVVVILLGFIGISTYRNLHASQKRAIELVHRQGLAIIQAVEAGARAGLISPMWEEDSIARLIVETAKNEDIAHIYLMNASGVIEHHSDPSRMGEKADWILESWGDRKVESRFNRHRSTPTVYEVAKKFSPMEGVPPGGGRHTGRMMMGRRMFLHNHKSSVIVAGLNMNHFEQARQEDIRHAVVMASILAALGSGAFFFIFVIQNYYLVNKTLTRTRDYARLVVANMASGLIGVDRDGRILSYNHLAVELLDLDEKKIGEISISEILDFNEAGIDGALGNCSTVLDKEMFHRRPDGKKIPLALSATPILEETGECGGTVFIFRDLREIKRLEKKVRRAEKLAAIGQLSAAVAHEIRNPLGSMRGFAQFLTHTLKDRPRDREYAEIMVNEIDRINQVVSDLLTFASPLESKRKPADIAELIDHAVRLIEPELEARKARIRKTVDKRMQKVFLDGDQITQVLLNLLLNSLKELPPGGSLEIGAVLENNGSELLVWVEDEGPGIPPENQKTVFDPFFTTKEKGAGLGLSIVKKIVENHDGKVFLTSPARGKNRGVRVSFQIPAANERFDRI